MAAKGKNVFSTLRKLYNVFNSGQKKKFKGLVFLTFIGSLTDLIGLSFIIPIIGLVLSEEFYSKVVTAMPFFTTTSKNILLLYSVFLFFLVILVKNAIGLIINKVQVNFVRGLYLSSSANVLEKTFDKSLLDLQEKASNELVNKLSYQQLLLSSHATISAIVLINEAMIFCLTSVALCIWNWQLFLLLISVLIPAMGIFYSRIKNLIRNAGREKAKNAIQLHTMAQEMIFAYTDIKIAGTQQKFKKRFLQFASDFSMQQSKMDFMNFIPSRIIEITIFLCTILILLYSVFVIKDLEGIVTTISLFSVVAYRSVPSINRFVLALNTLNSSEFVLDDPDFQPADTNKTTKQEGILSFEDAIVFDHVSYRYPGDNKDVLHGCNLTIKKGDRIGIIGKSGAGKSTLIKNILGFLQPTQGNIRIDNVSLGKTNIDAWWGLLGYVRQDVFILNASFLENIAIGETKDTVDMPRLQKAIRLAKLDELVAGWEDGVFTQLQERGNNLSGGQKQRVAIARALYKGAKVLVFDEATSSLDTKTEEEITEAIRELGKEQLTIIIIAHRHTSLKYCEKIYRLENGGISETMSYDSLASQYNTGAVT
jgi:ABC-type bacteriocin/lantibiotic exporter with double-glycine peptidase domain